MPNSGVLLEAERIGRRHPNGTTWLIEDVTLAIGAGARLALTGTSGAGKTLLMRALARLDPLDRGEVRYRGQAIHRDAIPHFRADVIYLHQRATLLEETVEAALRKPYALKAHRQRKFAMHRVVQWFADLGRDTAFLQKKVADLSGGEIQITALVRALQLDPSILLLDEPTASLDAPTAIAVEQVIDRWLDENAQRAIVWVSHNPSQAQRMGRAHIQMGAGRLLQIAANPA
jgi:putative ABC transport system ATP-binding protein